LEEAKRCLMQLDLYTNDRDLKVSDHAEEA